MRPEVIGNIDEFTSEPANKQGSALPGFCFKNGYTLWLADLGSMGVKVELVDSNGRSAAVILPPNTTKECSRWLSRTLGQRPPVLPEALSKILGRLLKSKERQRILERGDKKTIKEALKLLIPQK